MDLGKLALLISHIAFGAVAFGALLGSPAALRRASGASAEVFAAAAHEHNRRSTLSAIAWLLVLATGVGLILMGGGFRGMPANYHAALGLVTISAGIAWGLDRPIARRLLSASPDKAARLRRGAAAVATAHQVLWVATLILMYKFF